MTFLRNNLIQSVYLVISKLKCFWICLGGFGLALTLIGALCLQNDSAKSFSIYIGAAVIGFACSAFFSCEDQFLLRGDGDPVYLVENQCCHVLTYYLASRETINAFGGVWSEIWSVSPYLLKILHSCSGKKTLNLREDAELYNLKGQKTYFAVLLGVRHGIPDRETIEYFMRDNKKLSDNKSELNKYLPGKDLVSISKTNQSNAK